jgi:hypothetical protein
MEPLHVMHGSPHALTQQTPSTQWPEPHCEAAVQASPFGVLPVWQVPAASQYWLALHSGDEFVSCEPAGRLTHAPSEPGTPHDWQVLVQALTQQVPSTQKLLVHSLAAPHVEPFGFFPIVHWPEPLHDWPALSHGIDALWSTSPFRVGTQLPTYPVRSHW